MEARYPGSMLGILGHPALLLEAFGKGGFSAGHPRRIAAGPDLRSSIKTVFVTIPRFRRHNQICLLFLFFYLVTLLYGSISSLNYTLETNQRLFTAWRPYVWPIKSFMTFGILLMLLQTVSMFFKDLYRIKGETIK